MRAGRRDGGKACREGHWGLFRCRSAQPVKRPAVPTIRAAPLRPADGRRQGLIGFTFVSTPFTRTVTFPWFRARSATIL
ncbi:hypothetical protein GCM10018966_097360 [Streptomyces yanii]